MSDKDFSGRLFAPTTVRPRRPLSIKASTASCSIRFSFRTIISGAKISCSLAKRLLRLITRRYKSFKSLVAKRPPSSCTIGRRSGGITGMTAITIHSGLEPVAMKLSITRKRLISLARFCPLALPISSRKVSASCSKLISASKRSNASAPIPTSTPCNSESSL